MTVIIQARRGSTRLPNKVLLPFFGGKTILDIVISKCVSVFGPRAVVVATTRESDDDEIENLSRRHEVRICRGPTDDVLSRFVDAVSATEDDHIMRVCSDNPFLLTNDMRRLAELHENSEADYSSFSVDGTPSILTHVGLWTECLATEALQAAHRDATHSSDREHVTRYVYRHHDRFTLGLHNRDDIGPLTRTARLTLDTQEDYEVLVALGNALGSVDPATDQIERCLREHPEISGVMHEQIRRHSKE